MNIKLRVEKVVSGGRGLCHYKGRTYFVDGALPDELIRVRLPVGSSQWAVTELLEIIESSPRRSSLREAHAAACSPWQGIDYEYQLELKRKILQEIFSRPEAQLPVNHFHATAQTDPLVSYRNKIEFALIPGKAGTVSLGLHERGSATKLLQAPEGCMLASSAMNTMALALVERISALRLGSLATTLTIRQSTYDGKLIAILGVTSTSRHDWQRLVVPKLDGLIITTRTKVGFGPAMWSRGDTSLLEAVGGKMFRYQWDSFFQVNVPMFSRILQDIVGAVDPGVSVADLYGGVGVIGLTLAPQVARVIGLEINEGAVAQSRLNAEALGIKNYVSRAEAIEKMKPGLIEGFHTVIVDPPRSGLPRRGIEALLAVRPHRIIYVSCDPYTQARDIAALTDHYYASEVTGYDMYPGATHIESLVVLTRPE